MERNYNSVFSHVINYITVTPYLYRYENTEFIDKFFDEGEIKISSFNQYKKYNDNQLGDKLEGQTFNLGNFEKDNMHIGTYTSIGSNDYCFCTSTVLDKKLLQTFSRNSVFRIKDPMNFILEITKSLTRVIEVLMGNCIYLDNKMIVKDISNVAMTDLQNEQGSVEFEKIMKVTNLIQGADAHFIKLRHYQPQSEFRIIWKTDRPVDNGIIIKCPEAIKYCERIMIERI